MGHWDRQLIVELIIVGFSQVGSTVGSVMYREHENIEEAHPSDR